MKLAFLLPVALSSTAPARPADARWRPGGANVLVVCAADDADRDRNGTPDSLEAARYYARRRGVPAENLLALKLRPDRPGRGRWSYREFYERILKPVTAKLAAGTADGGRFSERICYILLCPGVPVSMTAVPKAPKGEKYWFRRLTNRSVDSYLISPEVNLQVGIDAETGFPVRSGGRLLGTTGRDLALPIFGAFASPRGRSFRYLRHEAVVNFYLVCRLGLDLKSARDMLDGALYAERYLRLPGPDERGAFRPAIWLDMKYRFASDHVMSMSRLMPLVQGLRGSPFAAGKGLLRVWPLVIDNQPAEIGAGRDVAHKPTVTATIARDGVDAEGVTLTSPRRIGRRGRDVPPVLYFPPGCKVSCWPAPGPKPRSAPAAGRAATAPATGPAGPPPGPLATARVVGIDVRRNRLLLDSTRGFVAGGVVKYVWGGEFPARDCFLFYGFYGLGQFEDVRQFPPGAIGVHVDSSCMRWARGAIRRGIAATFGVTSEPLSAGIPYGHLLIAALARGHDWAESAYGALRLAQRWMGVVFGDPLYAPFRSKGLVDRTAPVIGPVTVKPAGRGAVTVAASLAGTSPDELADVALFRLDYGPTARYGQCVDFFDWPQPRKGRGVKGRRFGYSRHFRWTLRGLKSGVRYHYRLTARDPAGLETRTSDAAFTAP